MSTIEPTLFGDAPVALLERSYTVVESIPFEESQTPLDLFEAQPVLF